jgi:hypothetical protein
MRERALLYFALGVLLAAALGSAPSLNLRDDGVQFPDGTLQTTAAPVAGIPIQDETSVAIPDFEICSPFTTLFTTPQDMRLQIEWIGIESSALFTDADPVDIDIETHDGSSAISHPIVRLQGSEQTFGSLFITQRWSTELKLYGAPGQPVRAQACRDGDSDIHSVRITFSGELFPAVGP